MSFLDICCLSLSCFDFRISTIQFDGDQEQYSFGGAVERTFYQWLAIRPSSSAQALLQDGFGLAMKLGPVALDFTKLFKRIVGEKLNRTITEEDLRTVADIAPPSWVIR